MRELHPISYQNLGHHPHIELRPSDRRSQGWTPECPSPERTLGSCKLRASHEGTAPLLSLLRVKVHCFLVIRALDYIPQHCGDPATFQDRRLNSPTRFPSSTALLHADDLNLNTLQVTNAIRAWHLDVWLIGFGRPARMASHFPNTL